MNQYVGDYVGKGAEKPRTAVRGVLAPATNKRQFTVHAPAHVELDAVPEAHSRCGNLVQPDKGASPTGARITSS